jgi:hypothetical protein
MILTLVLIAIVWLFVRVFGPIDTLPRLHASASSSDGALTVNVYRKRIAPFPSHGVDVIVKIYDKQQKLIYENTIGGDAVWDELNLLYREIIFKDDEIRVGKKSGGDYYIIRRSNLKMS